MSRENMEIVRRFWDAWDRGEVTELLAELDDDVVTRAVGLDDHVYHGKQGYLALLEDWNERFADWIATAEEFIEVGDKVVVRNHQSGKGEASGAPIDADYWFVYEVGGGKIVRQTYYADRREAFDAAGLP